MWAGCFSDAVEGASYMSCRMAFTTAGLAVGDAASEDGGAAVVL